MSKTNTIESQFKSEHSEDGPALDKARECAKLTLPHLMRDPNPTPNANVKENYQSVGATGLQAFTAKLSLAAFPYAPWFQFSTAPEILYSQDIDDSSKREFDRKLFMRQMTVQAVIESAGRRTKAGSKRGGRRRPATFHSHKHNVLRYCVCTGDVLERMDDDYRLISFDRDNYTTRRDSGRDVLHHITKEKKDPLSLSEEHRQILDGEIDTDEDKSATDRMADLYTMVRWEPLSKTWLVRQEIGGKVFNEWDEPISRFFATPFDLATNDHYGRGLIEQNLGDLRSLDNIAESLLDLIAAASRFFYVIDDSSDLDERDIEGKKSGGVLRCEVRGGNAQDIGTLDFSIPQANAVLIQAITLYKDRLGKAFLDEADAQPRGERVTATQIARIAEEIQGRMGSVSSSIIDMQQVPLIERTEFMMERDDLIEAEDEQAYDITTHSGFAALSEYRKADDLLEFGTIAAQMGPEALGKVDLGVLADLFRRYRGIYEPGLMKSDEKLAEEQAQQTNAAIESAAGQKAVDVIGNAAEQQLTGDTP